MPQRLQLIVAYEGGPFSGWQSQPSHNGVQDHLERAFAQIGGETVRVHGAGRTDAGVHALAQSAHVDLTNQKLTTERWVAALSATLPPTIRVLRCRSVSDDFHARFSAKGKIYRYHVYQGPVLPPHEYGRAWHVTAPVNFDLIRSAAALFVGKHDFAGFTANRGKQNETTTRTLRSVTARCSGPRITIEFDGDGFLYKMVRMIVGAIVQCGTGKISLKEISDRLSMRQDFRTRVVAPASGLFLVRVRY